VPILSPGQSEGSSDTKPARAIFPGSPQSRHRFRSPENHPVADARAVRGDPFERVLPSGVRRITRSRMPPRQADQELKRSPSVTRRLLAAPPPGPRSAARSAATETRVDGRRLQKVRVGKWSARARWPDRCGLNLCRPEWCTGTAYSHWRNRRPSGYCLFAGASREPASNKCRMNSRGRSRLVL